MNQNSPTERLASVVSNLKFSEIAKTVVDHLRDFPNRHKGKKDFFLLHETSSDQEILDLEGRC